MIPNYLVHKSREEEVWISSGGFLFFNRAYPRIAFNPNGSVYAKGYWADVKIADARKFGILLGDEIIPTHADANRLGFWHEGGRWVKKPVAPEPKPADDAAIPQDKSNFGCELMLAIWANKDEFHSDGVRSMPMGDVIKWLLSTRKPSRTFKDPAVQAAYERGFRCEEEPQPPVKPDDEALVNSIAIIIGIYAGSPKSAARNILANLRSQGALLTPEEIKAVKREVAKPLCDAFEEAFSDLFGQCCSNGAYTAWGKLINMVAINNLQTLVRNTRKALNLEADNAN